MFSVRGLIEERFLKVLFSWRISVDTPDFRFSLLGQKAFWKRTEHFENSDYHHAIFRLLGFCRTCTQNDSSGDGYVFKFHRRSVDGKHLMHSVSEWILRSQIPHVVVVWTGQYWFTFSKILDVRHFHVADLQRTATKGTKVHNAR